MVRPAASMGVEPNVINHELIIKAISVCLPPTAGSSCTSLLSVHVCACAWRSVDSGALVGQEDELHG